MNCGQLGGDKRSVPPRRSLRGSTLIAMMQAADLREGNNVIACGGSCTGRGRGQSLLSERCVLQVEDTAPAFEALKGRAEALYVVIDPLVTSSC
jgi:hypothetical protein